MRIIAENMDLTLPNITGSIQEILETYRVPVTGSILLNGVAVAPDTIIEPAEEDEITIQVKSTDIKVIKQAGEYVEQTVPYVEGMTIQDAIRRAMEMAGLNVNTDELTCIDYSQNPVCSYPAGLRSEKVKPGAELHMSTFDKYGNGCR